MEMVNATMEQYKRWLLIGAFIGCLGVLQADEIETEPLLKERPRLFRGPYNDGIIDSFYYGGYYGGFRGYQSLLYPYFSPLGLNAPIYPGRSTVTFAVGSDGYIGTSFSTSERIEGTNIVYGLSASWEQGENYFFPGYDYRLSRISPSLSWSNGRTSIFLSADFSEYSVDRNSRNQKERPRIENSGPLRSPRDYERVSEDLSDFSSVNVALSQRIGDSMSVYMNVGEDIFDTDQLSLGMSNRFFDLGFREYR